MAESSQTRALGSRCTRRWRLKKKANPQIKFHHVKNDQSKNLMKHVKKNLSIVFCYNCEKKDIIFVFAPNLKQFHSFLIFLFMLLVV